MFGRGQREDLDDDEAVQLAAKIRAEVEKDLEGMAVKDKDGRMLLGRL